MPIHRDQFDGPTVAALGLWAVVGSISLVLFGRAMVGAFDQPVSLAVPVLATVVVLSGSLAAWTLFHRDGCRGDVGRRTFDGLLTVVPAGLAGFSCSASASPLTLAVVATLLVCGLAYVAAREGIRIERLVRQSHPAIGSEAASAKGEMGVLSQAASEESLVAATEVAAASPIHQSLTRRTLPDGGEEIEAVLIARFVPGERQTALHLPIHPVLPNVPHVECEPLDDTSVSARPTAAHAYGVRVEVKRADGLDAPEDVPIGVLITSSQSKESAA